MNSSPFTVLFVCCVWPEPDSSAAGGRTVALINSALGRGYAVHAICPGPLNQYSAALHRMGCAVAQFDPNQDLVDRYLAELQPTIVFFDRFMLEEQFSWRVRAQAPRAIRVLDTIDLHLLRRARQRKALQPGNESVVCADVTDAELVSDDTARELAAILRSDLTLVVSDVEREFLTSRMGLQGGSIHTCSLGYPAPRIGVNFNQRAGFVGIGNINHAPNFDSFRVLKSEIWPRITDLMRRYNYPDRADRNVNLSLYGAYPNAAFQQLADPRAGILAHGRVPDAVEAMAMHRVNLAPLRFGAGVKGKIADGWLAGTPCVTTSIGAEGMTASSDKEELRFGGFVHDNWDDFARAAVELYTDEAVWKNARSAGLKILSARFNGEQNLDVLWAEVERRLALRLANGESLNWMQELVWQQQLRSTEYFSRWIKAKNGIKENGSR